MRKYPYLTLSALIFIILVGPFLVKSKSRSLEIYPSINFPSGARVANLSLNTFSVTTNEIFGLKDSLTIINKEDFLGRIPVWYFFEIRRGKFGLEEFYYSTNLGKRPYKFITRNNSTPEAISDTKKWIRKRLKLLGYSDSILVARTYKLKYDMQNNLIESILRDERTFNLK